MELVNIIAQIIANPYFGIFSAAIILIAPVYFRNRKPANQIQIIVTTAGMLGTFLGIVAGLYLLNTDQLNTSVPGLIGGLKTAFLTSIAGLIASLAIQINSKGFPYYLPEQIQNEAEREVSLEEVLKELQALNKNISGDTDTSLATQIVKMRSDNNDNHKELKKSFDEFAQSMVNSNIDALAEAIEKVMGEFNTTVNERLGKTFDDFKQSVENLNMWQSDYQNQINSQTENMKAVGTALGDSAEAMIHARESLKEIVTIKEKFDLLLTELNAQLQGGIDFATAMKDLSTDLENSGKVIKDEMKEITYGAASEMEKTMNKTLADFGSSLADISGTMAQDFKRIQQLLEIRES